MLSRSGVKRRLPEMQKRGRPVTTGADTFQAELLAAARTVSKAYQRQFGYEPASDELVASLLRQRTDWPYGRYKVTSLITMLSAARAAARRAPLRRKITELIDALRADGHTATAAKIEKQCRHLLEEVGA